MEYGATDALKALMARQDARRAAGTDLMREDKRARRRPDSRALAVARSGGDFSGIGMSTTKGFRVIRVEPLLVVIDGGLA